MIGTWQTSLSDFTEVLDEFHSGHYPPEPGRVADGRVNSEVKDSLDRYYSLSHMTPVCHAPIFNALGECLGEYLDRYPAANSVIHFTGADQYNIQKYVPGGGYHSLHCERADRGSAFRHLAWTVYLNDIASEDGGATEFPLQELEIQPEAGLVAIFPTDWMYPHRGITARVEKYLMTGWYVYQEMED